MTVFGASWAASISFFKLRLEVQYSSCIAGLEDLAGPMVAEATASKQGVVRHDALIGNSVPVCDGTTQIDHRPGLPVGGRFVRPEERAGRVLMELATEVCDLLARELGPVATHTLVRQPYNPVLQIRTAPLHQDRPGAARDGLALGHRGAKAVEADRLQPRPMQSVFGPMICRGQGIRRLVS